MLINLFDSSGTLIGVTDKAGLIDGNGKFPNMNKALYVDSVSSVAGGYSAPRLLLPILKVPGAAVGGRTGLTAVVVGVMFLLVMFFSPLVAMVPPYATAGALIFVGV